MKIFKSKGLVVFLIVVLTFTVINSINVKKYDERESKNNNTYISMEKNTSIFS